MSEEQARPEILLGDLITGPGVYMSRSNNPVEVRDCGNGYWEAAWEDGDLRYHSSGERVGVCALDDPYQLIRWVGPLAEDIPTTSEQLVEIEQQAADIPATEYTLPEGWQEVPSGEPLKGGDEYHAGLNRYIRPIEVENCWFEGKILCEVPQPCAPCDSRDNQADYALPEGCRNDGGWSVVSKTDWESWPVPQQEEQPQPQPVQVREGRWRTKAGEIVSVSAMPTDHDDFSDAYPWWDGDVTTWANNGSFFSSHSAEKDLVEYLGLIGPEPEPQPQPQPEPDAELRIRLLREANDRQAETIKRLMAEARDLNMEIGGLQRQLSQRDDRVRDLETMHAAATQAVVDAGKQNDALRLQVQNRQQEHERQKARIEFLETLNAGNGAAIDNYRAMVEKLQGLVDTARQQLEAAAAERDELRAAIDQADKQLDQKDSQIRDLRIELDAAQQVPQPVSDEERERIWDEATEQAGQQVIRWLRPLTMALKRQPDERFFRFMAITLSVLPDLLPEVLGYAVEDEAGEE